MKGMKMVFTFTFRLDRRNVFEMYFIFRELELEVNMRRGREVFGREETE